MRTCSEVLQFGERQVDRGLTTPLVWLLTACVVVLAACGSDDSPGTDDADGAGQDGSAAADAVDGDTDGSGPVEDDVTEGPDSDAELPEDVEGPGDADVRPDADDRDIDTDADEQDGSAESLLLQPDEALTVSEGGVTLSIPAGAVTEATEITFEVSDSLIVPLPDGTTRVSPVVRLTPHGLALQEPAVVTFPVTGGGEPVEHWRLPDDDATTWTLQGTVDLIGGTSAEVSLSSFSLHGMGRTIPNCARCEDRECGEDPVCGGSCGECISGEVCNTAGQCEVDPSCEADCADAVCGPDGCGSFCGLCPFGSPQVCGSGACYASYSPFSTPCVGQPQNAPWAMVGGCLSRPHRSAYWVPTGTLEVEWSWQPPGALGFSTESLFEPMLSATGMIYVSGPSGVWAVYRGLTLWQYQATSPTFGRIVTPPAAYGQNVFVVTSGGYLLALDSQTGAVRWDRQISEEALNRQSLHSPLIVEFSVIVQGQESYLRYSSEGVLEAEFEMPDALNSAAISQIDGYVVRMATISPVIAAYSGDGTEVWSKAGAFGATFLATSHTTGTLMHFARDFAFDPTTKLIWRNSADGEEIRRITVSERPRMAISIGGQALVVSGWPTEATHQMIDVATGNVLHTFTTPLGIAANPVAAAAGTYFVTIDLQGLVRVHSDTGSTLTSIQLPSSALSSSDTDTGRTPVIGADGRIYVAWGAGGGGLFALRATE
jgi:outer membrane protein assembly factor BamB